MLSIFKNAHLGTHLSVSSSKDETSFYIRGEICIKIICPCYTHTRASSTRSSTHLARVRPKELNKIESNNSRRKWINVSSACAVKIESGNWSPRKSTRRCANGKGCEIDCLVRNTFLPLHLASVWAVFYP